MLEKIFRARPFKVRNADEYELANILNLFVSPISGLTTPFDYENSIIKGRMGSGKTMYLRANHAYYLYGLVPSLLNNSNELILPVFIRLSDFQHLTEPNEIYRAIIVKIVEELTSIYLHLQDAKRLSELHAGMSILSDELMSVNKFSTSIRQLAKLGSEEYIERITNEFGTNGSVKHSFFELSAQWKEVNFAEFKKKPNPGIKDIEECYKNLLKDQDGKILLLIDEAGSLDKRFFLNESGSAFFEILMNQFRTATFIRTKIAIYPNSYSDMLTETRYGDVVRLEDTVNNPQGYTKFRKKTINLIDNYLNPENNDENIIKPNDIFLLNDQETIYGDCLEQIIYASNGNMRRLIQLLDLTMNVAFSENQTPTLITTEHAIEALKEHAENTEALFSEQEKELLNSIISVCKARSAYKFTFPNMSPVLYKYTNKSQEYNIVNVEELGSGRRGTIYSFDYSFAVLKDIPTHYMQDSEKICRERSLLNGRWISRVSQINQELLEQAAMPGKIEGKIEFRHNNTGFIIGDNNEKYFYQENQIIDADKGKSINIGKRVRFYPSNVAETQIATYMEIL